MRPPQTRAGKRRLDARKPWLAALAAGGFHSVSQFVKAARHTTTSSGPITVAVKAGKVPPNHPFVAAFASALKLTPEQFTQVFSNGTPPMSEQQVRRLTTLGRGKPGRALMVHPTASRAATAARASKGVALRGTRNTLKRAALQMRQSTRTLVTTCNAAAMDGETVATFLLADLMPVLADYLGLKHVRGNLLVSPDFAERFG